MLQQERLSSVFLLDYLPQFFLAWYCPEKIYKVVKPAVELLAGIPSVVYGFFGMVMIVPTIRYNFGGTGSSILAASILLGIMILRQSSEYLKVQFVQYREVIMKVLWHWGQHMREVFSELCYRQQSQEFLQESFLV